jgi:DNA ligase-1
VVVVVVVVVVSLTAPDEAGRRGAGWVKVKPRHTLDLVILAAEWPTAAAGAG